MRRILVIASDIAAFERFRKHREAPRDRLIYFSPHRDANFYRGLSEYNTAIVDLGASLSPEHERVLAIYRSLGAPVFEASDFRGIWKWLSEEKRERGTRREYVDRAIAAVGNEKWRPSDE